MRTKHRDPICQECNGRTRFESVGRILSQDPPDQSPGKTYEIYRCEDCDLLTDRNGEPFNPR